MRVCCVLGDEVDEQVRLKDNEIFESVRQKIADLEHTVNELSQIPIKKEGTSIVPTVASACFFYA